jgi:hypothetical protein
MGAKKKKNMKNGRYRRWHVILKSYLIDVWEYRRRSYRFCDLYHHKYAYLEFWEGSFSFFRGPASGNQGRGLVRYMRRIGDVHRSESGPGRAETSNENLATSGRR